MWILHEAETNSAYLRTPNEACPQEGTLWHGFILKDKTSQSKVDCSDICGVVHLMPYFRNKKGFHSNLWRLQKRTVLCIPFHSIWLPENWKKEGNSWLKSSNTETDGKLHPDWQIEREERGSKKVGRVIEAENLLWASGCWQPKWMVSLPCPLEPLVLPTDVRPASNSQSNSLSMILWATLVPLQLFQSSNLTSIRMVKWKCTKKKWEL